MIPESYKLPSGLSPYQESFYVHLIEWKHKYITKEPGIYHGKAYDTILPEGLQSNYYPLYRPIVEKVFQEHSFKPHKLLGVHLASSQAACINLFTPLLEHEEIANAIFPIIKKDFKRLATDHIEKGFQFEFWDETNPLNDHTPAAGTDSDIAIAYYNQNNDLCLWLIEHKLTEKEFSTCGGYRSSGNTHKEWCRSSALPKDPDRCYYQYKCDYKYWSLTNATLFNEEAFSSRNECPFLGGENQLWRNQLMGQALQDKGDYTTVHFSVVYHHDNPYLTDTMNRYRELLVDDSVFSSFTSKDLIQAARAIEDQELQDWVTWFSDLYMIG